MFLLLLFVFSNVYSASSFKEYNYEDFGFYQVLSHSSHLEELKKANNIAPVMHIAPHLMKEVSDKTGFSREDAPVFSRFVVFLLVAEYSDAVFAINNKQTSRVPTFLKLHEYGDYRSSDHNFTKICQEMFHKVRIIGKSDFKIVLSDGKHSKKEEEDYMFARALENVHVVFISKDSIVQGRLRAEFEASFAKYLNVFSWQNAIPHRGSFFQGATAEKSKKEVAKDGIKVLKILWDQEKGTDQASYVKSLKALSFFNPSLDQEKEYQDFMKKYPAASKIILPYVQWSFGDFWDMDSLTKQLEQIQI